MKMIAWVVLLPCMLFAGMARAEDDSLFEPRHYEWACDASFCEIPRSDLAEIQKSAQLSNLAIVALLKKVRTLEAEKARLTESCTAKLEVVPKKKLVLPPGPYRPS